jgi:hypothetical protein
MKYGREDGVGGSGAALLVVLSEINSHLIEIRKILESNPLVSAAKRSCDVRPYSDFMTEEKVHYFESYVEATTHTGRAFNWSLDIALTSLGWRFQRRVAEQTTDGEQVSIDFEDVMFRSLEDLAENYLRLIAEFVESAKSFDFGSQLKPR